MRTTFSALLLPLLLAGCGGEPAAPPADAGPPALYRRAVEALGGREAYAGVGAVTFRLAGTLRLPGEAGGRDHSEGRTLSPPDRLRSRVVTDGLVTVKGVDGEDVWIRVGAAVEDPAGRRAAEERNDRDDLIAALLLPRLPGGCRIVAGRKGGEECLKIRFPGGPERFLFLDPETGLPARLERTVQGEPGVEARLVRTFSDWAPADGILFPRKLSAVVENARAELRLASVEVRDEPIPVRRPRDSGAGVAGAVVRGRIGGGDHLVVTHRGPLTDLARVDHLIAEALRIARLERKGPNVRIFREAPGADGEAVVSTIVPIGVTDEPSLDNLPRGVARESLPASDALVMPYTGPYPRDRSVYGPLLDMAARLDLVPAGPPRHAILSAPDRGEPIELRQEIRLPVTKGD